MNLLIKAVLECHPSSYNDFFYLYFFFLFFRSHEPSQMSVMNLYQAVRSLLHFSQLTAWYMSNKGMKPSHVIYRVGVPGDFTFISDDNFVKHDFPVADINKTAAIKVIILKFNFFKNFPMIN